MITRSTLLAGPCYISKGAVSWRMAGDTEVAWMTETDVIYDPLSGEFTEVIKDRWVEVSGTPLYYDPTNTNSIFFPYLSMATTPPGSQIFGTTDSSYTISGVDNLTIVIIAGAVTEMPGITAGVTESMLGQMKITGVPGTGLDPATTSSFYTITQAGSGFAYPAIPSTAVLGRQKWTAAWGTVPGFTAFQSYTGFKITHNLQLNWDVCRDNGQRVGALLKSYRPSCSARPSGNTLSQLSGALGFQGAAATGMTGPVGQGQRLDNFASDLVISGAISGTITIKGAAMKTGKGHFSAEQLHQGDVQWIGTIGNSSGTPAASLVLA